MERLDNKINLKQFPKGMKKFLKDKGLNDECHLGDVVGVLNPYTHDFQSLIKNKGVGRLTINAIIDFWLKHDIEIDRVLWRV
jgi:hypothetical protein